MELRIIETPHKEALAPYAIVRIDDGKESTYCWTDSKEEAEEIISYATQYRIWEHENDWYVRIPGLLSVCMNTKEAAEYLVELHKTCNKSKEFRS